MKIAIFAGPTGGHFYPALAFCEAFRKRHPEARILFVTGNRGRHLTQNHRNALGIEFNFIPDFPFPRPGQARFILRIFSFLFKLSFSFFKTNRVMNHFKPDGCIGFGSYLSFPGLVLSRWKKIPTLLHEQNQRMGQANTWLLNYADRIALSFEMTEPFLYSYKTILSGLPLRANLVDAARLDRGQTGAFPLKILILGGSQGSHSLNALWIATLQLFSDEEKSKIAVIHITGERDFKAMQETYSSNRIKAAVMPFYERMEEIYREADLAVTRAGAGTLFELALFGLPSVILPYPHAEGHQEANARYFEKEEAVSLVLEKECAPEILKERVLNLIGSSALRNRLHENLLRLAKPDAAEKLAEAINDLLQTRPQTMGELEHAARP